MIDTRRADILAKFESAANLASKGKADRWLARPSAHLTGFFLSYGLHRITRQTYLRNCTIFTGDTMVVPLPAGLDLYLVGVKSHDSEIRLARYLIKHVKSNSIVFDIGAHIGFYSALSANLAVSGQVHSFEPSSITFSVLEKNLAWSATCSTINKAVSEVTGVTEIYQLPQLYSEFDTLVEDALPEDLRSIASMHTIPSTTIDAYCLDNNCKPDFIKIDVEGAEYNVLRGAENIIKHHSPEIAMEVRKDNFDQLYARLTELATEMNYRFFSIDPDGGLELIDDLANHVHSLKMESDNVVLKSMIAGR